MLSFNGDLQISLLIIAAIFGVSIILHTLLWMVQKRTGNAGIIDLAWTLEVCFGSIILLCVGLFSSSGMTNAAACATIFLAAWGCKLGLHLAIRLYRDNHEDVRYQLLREKWGEDSPKNMLRFFYYQSIFVVIFLLPAFAITHAGSAHPYAHISSIVIFTIGVLGSCVADAQLARWRANPDNKGKTCRSGLWAWSRHPNFFFEWITWSAYLPLALSLPSALFMIFFLAILLFLLLRVTGIPYTEMAALRSRGDDYRRYQEEVSAFFPLPPRKSTSTSSTQIN